MQHVGVKACDRRQHWSVMHLTFAGAEGNITRQANDPRGARLGMAQRAQ